jgi:glycosyltransferase involved in cell wall biosynthesis
MIALAPHTYSSRILMTVDAVGGVWRYAMDLATGLRSRGVETVFAVFGPPPSEKQRQEAKRIGRLFCCDAPLDWMAECEAEILPVAREIMDLAHREKVDLLHLNLPSQAAGLHTDLPVVVVSHSCVATWFHIVRGEALPPAWDWQHDLNGRGFQRADVVVSPSRSHAEVLREVYGGIDRSALVHNASAVSELPGLPAEKEPFVFAAGRWWDEGKNGAVLDTAAAEISWPVVMAGALHGPSGQQITLQHAVGRKELSHQQTMEWMARASIVVSPSLYEPFGLVALEAARLGSALVLADIPTYRELWDGVALFFDPRKPAELASAVNRLAHDDLLRAGLAERALSRSQAFNLEAQAGSFASLYGRLLVSADSFRTVELS